MASSVFGALIGMGLGSYGSKPTVPGYPTVDVNQTQQQTTAGNQASFADIAKLASGVNAFNQDQLNALIDRVLPGARQQIQQTLSSQLRGEIPQDVQNAIFRSTAERTAAGNAFGGGGDAGFVRNINARDLGLTSLQITNQALSSAEGWLKTATAPTMDVTSMFFTPQQRLAQANLTAANQYQNALLKAGVAAAPDPAMAALGQGFDQEISNINNAGLSMMGNVAGAAGGAAAGGGL